MFQAADGDGALETLRNHLADIALILLDVTLPERIMLNADPLPFAWRTTPNSEAALAFIPRAQSTYGRIVLFAYAYMWVVLFACSGTLA